jgi:hypothetical protein
MIVSLIWAAAVLAVTTIAALAGLKAWRAWIDFKRYAIAVTCSVSTDESGTGIRIELAGIKERLRKLEAIAQGVDL